ncbi:MAG TPA: hypothetical protein VJ783_18100, partial [Pirellulales bacterium]|nr:hypothetical protein [Pirellulales bacterium]
MPATSDWLHLVNDALDYQALQQAFSEIAARAQTDGDDPQLAQAIDEAVRRIEQERASDERELSEIQERYASFQQENRGLTGWFKRHMPFTETRRQDRQHRTEVADQEAEILADNLVIARAQMLKERFLKPADRKLGRRPPQWQAELAMLQAVAQLPDLANAIRGLAAETAQSRDFLKQLHLEIEAFAGAAFAADDDRRRRDAELAVARQELADLQREVTQEDALKHEALGRLGRLVTDELTAGDAAFRNDAHQIERLAASAAQWKNTLQSCGQLTEVVGRIGGLAKELAGLPGQMLQLRDGRQRFERQQADAAVAEARATAIADERRTRCEDARRALDQAQRALDEAKQAEAAHRAERLADKSMPQMVEAEPDDSPSGARQRAAQAAFEAAQATFREQSAAADAARREAEQARAALTTARTQLQNANQQITAIEGREPQLRSELSAVSYAGQAAFATAAMSLASLLRSEPGAMLPAAPYGWLQRYGLESALAEALFHADRDYQRHLQAAALLGQVSAWLQARVTEIERERSMIAHRRAAAWKRCCQELLGESLAGECCDGKAP